MLISGALCTVAGVIASSMAGGLVHGHHVGVKTHLQPQSPDFILKVRHLPARAWACAAALGTEDTATAEEPPAYVASPCKALCKLKIKHSILKYRTVVHIVVHGIDGITTVQRLYLASHVI